MGTLDLMSAYRTRQGTGLPHLRHRHQGVLGGAARLSRRPPVLRVLFMRHARHGVPLWREERLRLSTARR
jgi:hypothetical protein